MILLCDVAIHPKCENQNWAIIFLWDLSRKNMASGVRRVGVLAQFCLLHEMWPKSLYFSASVSLSDSLKMAGVTVQSPIIFPNRPHSAYKQSNQRAKQHKTKSAMRSLYNKMVTRYPHKPQRQSATTKPVWHRCPWGTEKREPSECLVAIRTGETPDRQQVLVAKHCGLLRKQLLNRGGALSRVAARGGNVQEAARVPAGTRRPHALTLHLCHSSQSFSYMIRYPSA